MSFSTLEKTRKSHSWGILGNKLGCQLCFLNHLQEVNNTRIPCLCSLRHRVYEIFRTNDWHEKSGYHNIQDQTLDFKSDIDDGSEVLWWMFLQNKRTNTVTWQCHADTESCNSFNVFDRKCFVTCSLLTTPLMFLQTRGLVQESSFITIHASLNMTWVNTCTGCYDTDEVEMKRKQESITKKHWI